MLDIECKCPCNCGCNCDEDFQNGYCLDCIEYRHEIWPKGMDDEMDDVEYEIKLKALFYFLNKMVVSSFDIEHVEDLIYEMRNRKWNHIK